jgi:peptidase M1-like protein
MGQIVRCDAGSAIFNRENERVPLLTPTYRDGAPGRRVSHGIVQEIFNSAWKQARITQEGTRRIRPSKVQGDRLSRCPRHKVLGCLAEYGTQFQCFAMLGALQIVHGDIGEQIRHQALQHRGLLPAYVHVVVCFLHRRCQAGFQAVQIAGKRKERSSQVMGDGADQAYLGQLIRSQYGYLLEAPYITTLLRQKTAAGRPVLQIMHAILGILAQPMSDARILQGMGVTSIDQATCLRALGFLGVHPGSADARSFQEAARSSAPADPPRDDLFPGSVYNRGAMALQALRVRVGDPTFFRILRTYAARYRYGNADTADFIALTDTVSGRNLTSFFHTWLYAPVAPPMPALLPSQ